jgi:hypothetical protein
VCSEEGRAVHGHTAAASGTFTMPWSTAYMIGMITLHDSSSPEQALLERLEWRFSAPSSSAGPSWIASVRREAVSVIRRLPMRRWRVEHEPPTPCTNPWCGVLETAGTTRGGGSAAAGRAGWWKQQE